MGHTLGLAHQIARGWIALLMAVVVLIYFAGADLLHLARLGAYVALAEDDAHSAEPEQKIELVPLLPEEMPSLSEPA